MISNVFALIMFLTLNGHNSTPLSSQKLSVAPLESSRRDAHNSKKSNFSVQTQHTLLFASFVEEEFDFRCHESSKTAKSFDLS